MTDQINLNLLWASGGGATPLTSTKYENGWIAEIPTFQNFNYMLQGLDQNVLHYAESSSFVWEPAISYKVGARVVSLLGVTFTARVASLGTNPDNDSTNSTWVHGWIVGANADTLLESDGFRIDLPNRSTWYYTGVDQTIVNNNPMIELRTRGTTNNIAIGNAQGHLVVHDLGQGGPDGRSLGPNNSDTNKIFHEGHHPQVAEVVGAIPDSPTNGPIYGRSAGGWTKVTSTAISAAPPMAVVGNGQGWYNLDDGQMYVDIDDGDSSQWVPTNPPLIIELPEERVASAWVNFDGTTTPPSIRDNYNIIDITDLGAGEYQANFETNLANNNYSAVPSIGYAHSYNVGSFRITTGTDQSTISATVFGGN